MSSGNADELNENIKLLTEMVTMLESDNKTYEEKIAELE